MQFWSIFTNIMEASLEESLYRNVSSISEIWEGLLPPIFLSIFRVLSSIWWSLFAKIVRGYHCVKSVRIGSYSGLYFSIFGLNMERYGVSLCIQSEYEKMRTRITPNTDTFHVCMHCSLLSSDRFVKYMCSATWNIN